jgi:hypothetical protein
VRQVTGWVDIGLVSISVTPRASRFGDRPGGLSYERKKAALRNSGARPIAK